ncbi:hypothetical protein KSS87_009004 [Heliosperma pusillum]|nr:hypothetical protein KSS87_009004 [Heliosperma pusillum]
MRPTWWSLIDKPSLVLVHFILFICIPKFTMSLFRGSLKLHRFLQSTSANPQSFSFSRHFCTGNEQIQNPSSKFGPFSGPPSQGVVYGRLLGINESTLKTDIINLFEGCGLTVDDIKVEYDRLFNPLAMLLQFPSFSEFSDAFRENTRRGRLLRLEKVMILTVLSVFCFTGNNPDTYHVFQKFQVDRQQWDSVTSNSGYYVLLQGIPRNALLDDVERFLSGCNYISSSFEVFTRSAPPKSIRMAKVGFPSQIEAMNTIIQKNGSFCLNNQIITRLIQ